MSKVKIESKLDSISSEADYMMNYTIIKSKYDLTSDSSFVLFVKNDTFNLIVLNDSGYIQKQIFSTYASEEKFDTLKNVTTDTTMLHFLKHKRSVLNQLEKSYLTRKKTNFEFIFKQTRQGYNLFVLSRTQKQLKLPLDTNYVYQFDQFANLKKITLLPHKHTEISFTEDSEMIILVYDKNSPLIYSSDIYKFNRYCGSANIKSLSAFSHASKRHFIYDPIVNKIKVE